MSFCSIKYRGLGFFVDGALLFCDICLSKVQSMFIVQTLRGNVLQIYTNLSLQTENVTVVEWRKLVICINIYIFILYIRILF